MGTAVAVGMIPEFVHFQKFKLIVIIWLSCSAIADTVITFALVQHLVSTLANDVSNVRRLIGNLAI